MKPQTLETGRMKLSPSRLVQINEKFMNIPLNKLTTYNRNPVLVQIIETENLDTNLASEMPIIDYLCFIYHMQGNSQYRTKTDFPDSKEQCRAGFSCMYNSMRLFCKLILEKSEKNFTIKLYLYQTVKNLFDFLKKQALKQDRRALTQLYDMVRYSLDTFNLNDESSLETVIRTITNFQLSPWDMTRTESGVYIHIMAESYTLLTQLFLRPYICAYPQKFKSQKVLMQYLPDYGPDEDDTFDFEEIDFN